MLTAPKSTRYMDTAERVFNKTGGDIPDTMDWRDVDNVVPAVKVRTLKNRDIYEITFWYTNSVA